MKSFIIHHLFLEIIDYNNPSSFHITQKMNLVFWGQSCDTLTNMVTIP
jgi:hypothetical protein